MSEIVLALVNRFNESHLFALVVLFGVWKLLNKALAAFKESSERVADRLESVENTLRSEMGGIRSDLHQVVGKLISHEERISSLENSSSTKKV